MLGRAAYQEPWRLLAIDPQIFGERARYATMKDVFEAMVPYIERELANGTRLHAIVRHFVGAFHAVPGARAFRRHLAENGVRPGAGIRVLRATEPSEVKDVMEAAASQAYNACTPTALLLSQRLIGTKVFVK